MGGFILFFAFLAFNGGSVLTVSNAGNGEMMARAMCVTIMMGSAGSIGSLLVGRTFSCEAAVNGALAGMVAACAGCNQFDMWAGVIIGLCAASVFVLLSWVVPYLKVDDPTNAIGVHFAGGMIGELAVPIFSIEHGLVYYGNSKGALYKLCWQICGFVAVVVWCVCLVGIICFAMRLAGILRVPIEAEEEGIVLIALQISRNFSQHCKNALMAILRLNRFNSSSSPGNFSSTPVSLMCAMVSNSSKNCEVFQQKFSKPLAHEVKRIICEFMNIPLQCTHLSIRTEHLVYQHLR